MNEALLLFDYGVIVFYLAFVAIVGVVVSHKQSSESFLIADRKLGTFACLTSVVASKVGAGAIMTLVALVYLFGYSAIWYFVGASTGYVIFLFFAPSLKMLSQHNKFYTLPDYFFQRHGKAVGFICSSIVLGYMMVALLIQLIGGAKAVSHLWGISFVGSFFLIVVTIYIYTVLGGFKAVVSTDTIQFLLMLFILGFLGLVLSDGIDQELVLSGFNREQSLPMRFSISFFIGGVIMPFLSMELWQRIYAAADIKTVKKSLATSAIVYLVLGALICVIGSVISEKLTDIDPDLALVEGFISLLPSGLAGLGLILFFSAIMSSADSYLFACVATLTHDFFGRIIVKEKHSLVKLSRALVTVLLVICFVLSYWIESVVEGTFIFFAFGSVVAVSGITSWFFKNCRSRTIGTGMVVGVFGTLVVIMSKPIDATLGLNSLALTSAGFISEIIVTRIIRAGRTAGP